MNKKYDFLKGTTGKFILALIFGVAYNLMHVGPAYFMMNLVDAGNASDMNNIKRVSIQSLIYIAAFLVLGFFRGITMRRYKRTAMYNYKRMYIENVLAMRYNDFKKKDNGVYLSNLTNNAQMISDGFVEGRINIVRSSARVIAIVVSMLVMNWRMFLITIISFLFPILSGTVVSNKITAVTKSVSEKNAKMVTCIKDLLSGFGVIKSFNAEKEVCNSVNKDLYDLEDESNKLRQIDIYSYAFTDGSSLLMMLVVFAAGAFFVTRNLMTIGGLIAFVQLLGVLETPVRVLPGYFARLAACKKLIEQDHISNDDDKSNYNSLTGLNKSVEIKNLVFSYDGEHDVLNDIDLELSSKKLYAVVGASGSGKSTLAHLLCGNYSDYKGEILVDGKELRDIGNIYDILTVIDQNVFIFNDTIYNNISMFKEFSEEDMKRAIDVSGLAELIEEKGGDYQCGENGSNLSGGEKQRISIARAMLLKKDFIIMDESTSNLDIVTARSIENTVYGLGNTLRLVITHNLNDVFLKKCDEIIVIRNGKIAEHGNFDELIARKQVFSNMYELWA